MSIGEEREKYLKDLGDEIIEAGYNMDKKVGILMGKQEFFNKAFHEDRMTVKRAKKVWNEQYDSETGLV
jgi:hypothetical protein